jgi:endonuclease/exonuclease/phosphatase family metal-dependent hydrolase
MFQKIILSIMLCMITTFSFADVRVGTWNTMRLGSGTDKNFQALASVAQNFDFLAVQEVMTEEGIAQFKSALEAKTGEQWEGLNSHLVGRGNYKEMYSFLWRKSKVEYLDGAVVYLDRSDAFDREPFSARFQDKSNGRDFVAATVHIHYGKSDADRTPEIHSLKDYWTWLGQVYPDTKAIMVMGDFNMNPNDDSWADLKQFAVPLITEGASTLGLANGRFSSLYDNVWVGKGSVNLFSRAQVIQYPAMLNMTNAEARKTVSDHAPLALMLGGSKVAANSNVFSTPSAKIQPALTVASSGPGQGDIHGNKNSKIYHLPGCPNYNVAPQNLVSFSSKSEAEKMGYRMAKNCTQ